METYRVKVSTPGHMITFRRLQCRTPVEFKNVKEQEMKSIELQARISSLKCEIKKESEIEDEGITIEELEINREGDNSVKEETSIEELKDTSPKTILETLISENKD
jgi:hypothetical protein